ncbi:MAG: dienelactone hydrolase family protein [Cyclobacteriaceae bacterium]
MKKERSKRFKDYKIVQKIGVVLMLAGAVIILLKIFDVLSAWHFVLEDLPNFLFLAVALSIQFPSMLDRFRKSTTKIRAVITILAVFTSFNAVAQNYSKQINAFKESLDQKSVDPIKPYVSAALKFDPMPAANTQAILRNIVSNLPTLNSLEVLETTKGKARVEYNFERLGKRESSMHFDEDGKFNRIELIENLIQQEIKAQQRLQQSVQRPPMTPLAKNYTPTPVEFEAEDGLIVTGNLYDIGTYKPVILLGHQAGYNKAEYLDIAPKLNELGFNCLALDLRSGGNFADQPNQTSERAKKEGIKSEMVDARHDIKAAIGYLNKKYNSQIILWGSSYSASLALLVGASSDHVKAVIAFSPGDYFGNVAPSLATVFAKTDKPFWVTSSKEEAAALTALTGETDLKNNQSQFIPKTDGYHGASVLWTGQKGADEYWNSLVAFLNKLKTN